MVSAAPSRLGVEERAEPLGGLEGGEVAGGAGVPNRPAPLVEPGLGEQAAELDLAGVGAPVGRLAAAPRGVGGYGGHPGAVQRDVERVERAGLAERDQVTGCQRVGFLVHRRPDQRAVRFGAPFHPLGRQLDPGQLSQILAGHSEGLLGPHPRHHRPQPRAERAAGHAELGIPGQDAMATRPAVVVGPPQGEIPHHRVELLGPVADEGGPVALPAVDAGTPVAGIEREQVFEQVPTELGHRGPDRELERPQALRSTRAAEGARSHGGQPL